MSRKPKGTQFLYGYHTVAAAWLNPRRGCRRLMVTESALKSFQSTLVESEVRNLQRPPPIHATRSELDRLVPGAVHQGFVLETSPISPIDLKTLFRSEVYKDVIILDQVTDPHNIGAILRSAAVFDCMAVILTRRYAPFATAVVAKSACGALEHVSLVYVANISHTLGYLHRMGYLSVGLDERARHALHTVTLSQPIAFVFGAEGRGLRRLTGERCNHLVTIPVFGPIKTLNVSNVAALALYERTRQKMFTPPERS